MIANEPWHIALPDALVRHARAALVVVAASAGSTPREAGAAMVVTADSVSGTIGGGHLEHEAMRIARDALQAGTGASQWLVRFPLAARLGQCCGGVATLAFAVIERGAAQWLEAAAAHVQAGTPFAVASVIGHGAQGRLRIVVDGQDSTGMLGNTTLDAIAVAQARSRLAQRLGTGCIEADGVTVFLHVVEPDAFDVFVFGNGHVGRALVQVLTALPCHVRWIDTREHDFPDALPRHVDRVVSDTPEDEIAGAPRGSCVIVMTHSHALDLAIVDAALRRDDWRYLGLIGSRSKRMQFERRLVARGTPREALARLTCPIGSGVLKSKEPGVIAIAVAAQMLEIRQGARASATHAAHWRQR